MHVEHYRQTVRIHLAFTDAEEQILDEARTSALGPYWAADELGAELTIEELELITNTLGVCLGHEQPDVNIFAIDDGECAEDVPGGGTFATVAENLYRALRSVLAQWRADESPSDW